MKNFVLLVAIFCISCNGVKDLSVLKQVDCNVSTYVSLYEESKVINTFDFVDGNSDVDGKPWQVTESITPKGDSCMEVVFDFAFNGDQQSEACGIVAFNFDNWTTDNYVIMPGALYEGNRFDVLPYGYAPFYKKEDYGVDRTPVITNVPRLNIEEGISKAEFTSGDLTTPALGVYFPKQGKGLWIIMDQSTKFGNIGLTIVENDDRSKAALLVSTNAVREKSYTMTSLGTSSDRAANWVGGDKAAIKANIYVFDANSVAELNNRFLTIRKDRSQSEIVNQLPFSEAYDIISEMYNREHWQEAQDFYALGERTQINNTWQLGWVGGCISTHPLALLGDSTTKSRAYRNYNKVITGSQAPSGFYYGCGDGDKWYNDCLGDILPDNVMLLRKNGDALYFFYKYIEAQKAIDPSYQMPQSWKEPLLKFADSYVKLWNKYGQFGQWIDVETGDIVVGGSSSAVMGVGALVLAARHENRPELLDIAKKSGKYYYDNFVAKGFCNGGPGEILQCPDAESTYAALESLYLLYEETGDSEWLRYAEDAAALFSTWVVTYDYAFPDSSLFGKMDMKTTGSVWANVQNKHSAPGICTASGDVYLKLYRATGNELYIDLLRDISHNIMQYVSRSDRPVSSLHVGWINERVNMSDWEGLHNVGNVFHGTTWADVSAMLTVAEIPSIYLDTQADRLVVFDHVNVEKKDGELLITNPTNFDAFVTVFVDNDRTKRLGAGDITMMDKVFVKSKGSAKYKI